MVACLDGNLCSIYYTTILCLLHCGYPGSSKLSRESKYQNVLEFCKQYNLVTADEITI